MELFIIRSLLLLIFVQASLSVIVTLEGGGTGTVNKEVVLGSDVILQCSLSASSIGGTPRLEWTYAKVKFVLEEYLWRYQIGEIPEKYKDKFFLQPPFSLGIKNVSSSDWGYYLCRGVLVRDSPAIDYAMYNLTVIVPPHKEISCGFPKNSTILVGKSAEFRCAEVVEQAKPAPVYEWFKNGVKLPVTSKNDPSYIKSNFSYDTLTGILKFENVVDDDAGQYYCAARNNAGSSQCSVKQIMAITPPYNEISCGFPKNSSITVGGSAEFHCAEVIKQASPPPLFKWFKDGIELPMEVVNNSVYPNSDFSYNFTTGILLFKKVARDDAGEYYCTAQNVGGLAQCTATRISTSAGIALKVETLMSLLVGLLLLHLLL